MKEYDLLSLRKVDEHIEMLHKVINNFTNQSLERVKWQYFSNPVGKLYIDTAIKKDFSPAT